MRSVAAGLSRRGAVARCGLPLYASEPLFGDTLLDFDARGKVGDVQVERFGRRARFLGVRACRNVWECSICAERKARESGEVLRVIAEANRAKGGGNYTVTLTLRHARSMALEPLLDGLVASWRKVLQGNPWKRQADRYAVVGYVRAPEVTYGDDNGWHPHLHVALFSARRLSTEELSELREWLVARWRRIVGRQFPDGSVVPNSEQGVVCRPMYKSDYLAKFGLGGELAKQVVKRSKGAHRSPWDMLLALTLGSGTDVDRALWREYASAMHGHKQLTFSKGLRERFNAAALVEEQRVAEAVLDGTSETPEVVLHIDGPFFVAAVHNTQLEVDILRAAESGRRTAVIERWWRRAALRASRARGLPPPPFLGAYQGKTVTRSALPAQRVLLL